MLYDTRAVQFDVLNVASERKNAPAIAQLLERMARKMTDGDMDKLVGWILDNT